MMISRKISKLDNFVPNLGSNRDKNKTAKTKSSLLAFSVLAILTALIILPTGCGGMSALMGDDSDQPKEVEIPSDPINRAAVNGLMTSYSESTMWQIQNVEPIGMTPMAPSGELLELQDPKEIYCVCLQYEARYKVTWSTSEGSPWKKTVRNILVIRTQGDQYLAVKPMNVCSPFCG
jgi:hypothetical protein